MTRTAAIPLHCEIRIRKLPGQRAYLITPMSYPDAASFCLSLAMAFLKRRYLFPASEDQKNAEDNEKCADKKIEKARGGTSLSGDRRS